MRVSTWGEFIVSDSPGRDDTVALGDGIRRNAATITPQERERLRNAFIVLDLPPLAYPDGVSYWDKQNQIHQATHVHVGPAFLPWHRELCNRLEALLRQVDRSLSLHYWDWTTDPRPALFSSGFMGSSGGPGGTLTGNPSGDVGLPFWNPGPNISTDVRFNTTGSRNQLSPITSAPFPIWRNVKQGAGGAPTNMPSDSTIMATGSGVPNADQYRALSGHQNAIATGNAQAVTGLELAHNRAHGYIGGTVGGDAHFAFHDPFVFFLHSNVDRLWAMWQTTPGQSWRLDPNVTYGVDGNTTKIANAAGFNGFIDGILTPMEPWAGNPSNDPSVVRLRPWAPPENQTEVKDSKHPSVVLSPRYDTNGAIEQETWRWCSKCQGLAFAGGAQGSCPAGGAHDHSTSGHYRLFHNAAGAPGQSNWRWCSKCQGLTFGGGAPTSCPAGGNHDLSGSGDYTLVHNMAGAPGQSNWRWCNKCHGLAFGGGAPGPCPAGGNHDHTGSGDYTLAHTPGDLQNQDNWRWCNKCQGLAFGGGALGVCPAGGAHNHTGSGNYSLVHNGPVAFGQNNWRWCQKCQGLAFGGGAAGQCPAGGVHDHSVSGNYALVHNALAPTGQDNWRWCQKCQGLAFNGGSSPGPCPAGALHDHAASGNYSLWQ
jgi:hypothetical protein